MRKKEEYDYAKIKQDLKIKDLQRYGIETVLVNEYPEIPKLISKIEEEYLKKYNFYFEG